MDGEWGGRERGEVGEQCEIRDGGGGWAGRRRLALTEVGVGLEMEMGRLSLSHGGG